MASITLTGIAKRYGRQAPTIEGLDLAIPDGDFVVILGPSGCGKSTLLRMIAGLEEVSAGTVAIDGRRVNDVEPKGRGCAMVFQNYALYPHMSVAQNIGYALRVARVPRPERDARVRRVAEILGLADFLDRRPAALSGGQRQRVAMGRAMIREPKVFLFDEPLSNLDAKLRVQMRLEIRRLHQRLRTTSVFVTHDQVEAMTLADLLVVMNRGRIEQVGTPAEVYNRPATRFVAEFMGSPPFNILRGRGRAGGEVEIEGGERLPLPPGLELPQGAPVDLGFRAEHAALAEGDGPGLPFVLDLTEDLGTAHLLHGRVGATPVVVSVPPGTTTPSSRLRLRVPAPAMHAFDAERGTRLEAVPLAIAAE